MEKVLRSELLDYVTYDEARPDSRPSALEEKEKRRIHVGENLTFLFENTDTVRYQIQEMMRIERIVKEDSILHEMKTYNGLLGEAGELGCTLLIEYNDEEIRNQKLTELLELPKHIFLEGKSGRKYYAQYDESQVGETRVSSVQFLKFICDEAPVRIGTDHPSLSLVYDFNSTQQDVFAKDLL